MNTVVAVGIVLELILAGFILLRRVKGAKMYGPLAMVQTERLNKFIDRIANLSPRFWKAFSTVGIVVGFFWMFLIAIGFILSTESLLRKPAEATPSVMLAIPGVTIPLIGGLVGIIVLVVFHEFSHGIVARAEKIKLDSVGTLSLGFIPLGAFVKPDEKKMKKAGALANLRVAAAGSFMNILLATVLIALTCFAILPGLTAEMTGAKLLGVDDGSPAEAAGLQSGMIITGVNGEPTDNLVEFAGTLTNLGLQGGDQVTLLDAGGTTHAITTVEKGGRGYIGITFCGQIPNDELFLSTLFMPLFLQVVNPECYQVVGGVNTQVFWFTYGILIWVIIMNLGVGIFNLLQIKPLDGGLMLESLIGKFSSKKFAVRVINLVSVVFLLLLLINIFGPHLFSAIF